VPVRQVAALESLARILSDSKIRHGLALEARRSAESEFGMERHVCRVQEIFLKTVHGAQLSGTPATVEIKIQSHLRLLRKRTSLHFLILRFCVSKSDMIHA
jgi:hypothetical protein